MMEHRAINSEHKPRTTAVIRKSISSIEIDRETKLWTTNVIRNWSRA